jgi:hypothetical protein
MTNWCSLLCSNQFCSLLLKQVDVSSVHNPVWFLQVLSWRSLKLFQANTVKWITLYSKLSSILRVCSWAMVKRRVGLQFRFCVMQHSLGGACMQCHKMTLQMVLMCGQI